MTVRAAEAIATAALTAVAAPAVAVSNSTKIVVAFLDHESNRGYF